MPTRPRRRLLVAAAAALALVGTGCGDDDDTPSAEPGATTTTGQEHGCAVAAGGEVELVADDLAWDVPCIQAPEGIALTITVRNEEADVNHNLRVVDLPGEPMTPLALGPSVQSLELGAELLTAGTYAYVCDIHPTMTGELEVLAPLAEGPTSTSA